VLAAPESREEIDRRLAAFRRSSHASDLWPDIPVETFRAAEAEVARVATEVLRGAAGPVVLRSGLGARALGVAAFQDGMGALLGFWCETGRVAAEADIAATFAIHLEHGRRRMARLRHELERVVAVLGGRGVEVWVLKGMHTAYRYFPEPGARYCADIDLLVRAEDEPAAREVLTGLGLVEARHPHNPRDSAWAPRSAQPVRSLSYDHADGLWSVDLHTSLDRQPFEGLATALGAPELSAGEVWNEYCQPVRVLAQPLLLAYLALHASSHFYSMMQVRLIELVLVARRDFGTDAAKWAAFGDLVVRTASGRFVYPALALAERLLPGTMDRGVLDRIAAATPRRLRRLVKAMTPMSPLRIHPVPAMRERFVWVGSPREALAALWWLVWPREDQRPVASHRAVVAQWRRVRRGLRRMLFASAGR